jgi:flagellar hook capping protein FlgD
MPAPDPLAARPSVSHRFLPGRAVLLAAAVTLPLASFAPGVGAQPVDPAHAAHVREIKQIQIELMHQGARRRFDAARRHAAAVRKARRAGHPLPAPGDRARKAPQDIDPPGLPSARATGDAPRSGISATAVIPTNVRANNPAGDGAGSGQAEEAIAARGNNVLMAWNDGQGFVTATDTQGYAWSTDGGATFTDGGAPPDPPGFPAWVWTSDPVVTVNETTGDFWYCGLANSSATTNAIGVARGHFGGAGFVWDQVVSVRSVGNAFLDKQWMVADATTTGNLYLSYTTFLPGPSNQIDYQRSTDNGATWSAVTKLSAMADDNLVQGSRPVAGPDGEVYVVWAALGASTYEDFFRLRRCPAGQGGAAASFAAQVTAASYIANFGTGAPGFNRERGIHFPSIAVDRTSGVNRGRVYLTWNESYNHIDEVFSAAPSNVEVEPNDAPGTATPFTVGNKIRGTTSSVISSDLDYFSCSLTAGQHLVVWADTLPASQTYTLRLFAPDTQRLCFGGDLSPGTGVTEAYYTFTAPVTGTYYLRMAPAYTTTDSKTGAWMVRTKLGTRTSERGRDQRDVFLTWSDDGTVWSTPSQVNDEAVGFDDWLPEVLVGADGHPYVKWFDWRDDTHGSRSHQYIARSTNGGTTWAGSNRRFSSAQSDFTNSGSNIAPNQGDYSHMGSDGRFLHVTWADGRGADVDAWTTAIDTDFQLAGCPADQAVTAGGSVPVNVQVSNLSPLFSNQYPWSVSAGRGWPLPAPGSVTVAESATGPISFSIAVPETAASGVVQICLDVANATGSRELACCFDLDVTPAVGVAAGALELALGLAVPNPSSRLARLAYSLPAPARVRVTVFGLRGEAVRDLVDGERGAGSHTATWDGRDDGGHAVPAGAYFVRMEALGRSVVRRLVWMR